MSGRREETKKDSAPTDLAAQSISGLVAEGTAKLYVDQYRNDLRFASELREVAFRTPLVPRELVALATKDDETFSSPLAPYFAFLSGFNKRLTVSAHTQLVLTQKLELFEGKTLPGNLEHGLLNLTLLLHDLGKGYAHATGRAESSENLRILDRFQKLLGLSEDEFRTVRALVAKDPIGLYMQDHNSAADSAKELSQLAESSGLSVENYFRNRLIIYRSDAGAYPHLRRELFADGPIGPLTSREHFLGIFSEGTPRDRIDILDRILFAN